MYALKLLPLDTRDWSKWLSKFPLSRETLVALGAPAGPPAAVGSPALGELAPRGAGEGPLGRVPALVHPLGGLPEGAPAAAGALGRLVLGEVRVSAEGPAALCTLRLHTPWCAPRGAP